MTAIFSPYPSDFSFLKLIIPVKKIYFQIRYWSGEIVKSYRKLSVNDTTEFAVLSISPHYDSFHVEIEFFSCRAVQRQSLYS